MEQQDYLIAPEKEKLSTTLNVLTILTFIGCGILLISSVYAFATADTSVALLEKAMSDMNRSDMPSFVKKLVNEDTLALAKLQAANKIPILVINLLSFGLCLAGAIQMRKQKMQGYYYWLIGEVLPIIGMGIFASFGAYKGFGMFGLLFPVVFIILYTTQRSNLTK